jgi:hypothetical protein
LQLSVPAIHARHDKRQIVEVSPATTNGKDRSQRDAEIPALVQIAHVQDEPARERPWQWWNLR